MVGGLVGDQTPPGSGLHPAFVLSPGDVEAAIKRGEDTAKKGQKLQSLTDKYSRKPHWVRGKKGTVHESRVWCSSLDGTGISLESYRAASKYETLRIPDFLRKSGGHLNTLDFEVVLTSAPKLPQVAQNGIVWSGFKAADEADVRVEKFVLSDDRDHFFEANEGATSGTDSSGSVTESGISAIPKYTEVTNANVSVSANAYGTGGHSYAQAYGYGSATSTRFEYVPWSQQHPYFQARYRVCFSLFDKDGKPRISRDAKEIVLRIVTANGEQDVTYLLTVPQHKK